MKTGEVIRTIAFCLIGALLVFWVQPLIYRSRALPFLQISNLEAWLSNLYVPAATLVFVVSLLSTLAWDVLAVKSTAHRAKEVDGWRLAWWGLGLFPVLAIGGAFYILRLGDIPSRLLTTFFFVLDFLWIYWWTTATSTPGQLKFIPPFALELRSLMGWM
jgi:hypothetical protein